MTLAIDCSNYTTGFNAQALAGAGVRRAVVQLVNERVLTHREQIPALLGAGIEVEAYVYQWFSGGPSFIRHRMNWALDELAFYPDVRRVWLDCEQSGADDPPYAIGEDATDMIRLAASLAAERGYEVGIYTAAWWWPNYVYGDFSHLPLWLAQYDGLQDVDCGIGNWRAEMKQYAGIGEIAGVGGIDFNCYEEDAVEVRALTQSEAIEAVKVTAQAVGPDHGQWYEVTGGYQPKPGRRVYLVEVNA